ncbi:DUF6478 family protein [Yoonia sediminilitoris]|uniref:Uncharacterized protein n=1 Tax=Yoonia sediminilitoris TaxID=1286148 RepID=A0A2T6KIL2_9RHOB|nr:DUF6478 family protein [Yoonia sediminilitoris]PUB15562.1 hypothetical protein C8N45_104182 [Yoonia sediminilitoris]RCW96171.1 hypothetical protein DFP92_104181 [Yoonia sediminilitoris]
MVKPHNIISKLRHRLMLTGWTQAAREAETAELATLRAQRQMARQLCVPLQELSHIADGRLGLPRIGSSTFARPAGTDWSWRPRLWRGALPHRGIAPAGSKARLGTELRVFHDCPLSEISLQQVRNSRDHDLAPFGVAMEIFGFQGSFLSLVIDLPDKVCEAFRKQYLIQLAATVEREHPMKIYARLNVKHGPNVQEYLLTVPDDETEATLAFDLAYGELNVKRVEKMWLDLIFENPGMNKVTLRDLNFCRYPRAEI